MEKNSIHKKNIASLKVPAAAFSLAVFSVICALSIGFFAFKSSVDMTERNYHEFYLKEAQMLVKAAEIQTLGNDKNVLNTIRKIWAAAKGKPADEYICIVDNNARLILHSAHPETIGNDAGKNKILGNGQDPACTLNDLVKTQQDYVGEYISSAGHRQIAAFAASLNKNWMIGIHRSKAALMKDIEGGMRFSKYGFLIICGLLMPLSLLLIYATLQVAYKKTKQVEKALVKSEEKYRQMVESTADWVWACDTQGCQTFSNKAVKQILGYESNEILGNSIFNLMHPEYRKRVQKWFEKAIKEKRGWQGAVTKWRHKNGSPRFLETTAQPIIDAQGNLTGFSGIDRDITDRKLAEESRLQSEARYKALFDNINSGVAVYRAENDGEDFIFVDFNRASEKIENVSKDQVLGKSVLEIFPGVVEFGLFEVFQRVWRTGNPEHHPITMYRDERISGWRDNFVYKLTSGEVVAVYSDETERKKAEEERDRLFNLSLDMLCIAGFDGYFKQVNPAFSKVLGWSEEELLQKSWLEFVHPDDRQQTIMAGEQLEQGKPVTSFENRYLKKDGTYGWISWNSFPKIGEMLIFAVAREITQQKLHETERRKLEEQLRQSHKMEAIGTLAGGIAHDFNNILFSIVGFTELALDKAPKGSSQYQNLREVLTAANRAKDLVKQILTFSRQADQEKKPVQVKLIVKEALKLLRASIPSSIEIRQNIKSSGLIMGDATQIHQVLMNLCTNAAYAMGDKAGTLTVELFDTKIDADFIADNPDIRPGPFINLTVTDTGHGIMPNMLDKIFDPFFTTKEKGEGTGMGLSVVHGIVHSHGGIIKVYSEPEKGSAFKVFLPAIERSSKPEEEIERPLPTGTECILFIDDEPAIVNLCRQTLESLGYDVVTRISSIEALELFRAQKDRFDLVITDLTMPKMTGEKLAAKLIQIKPDIPIILCTGFSAKIDEQRAMDAGIRAFISKPILKRELAETIRSVLDASTNRK